MVACGREVLCLPWITAQVPDQPAQGPDQGLAQEEWQRQAPSSLCSLTHFRAVGTACFPIASEQMSVLTRGSWPKSTGGCLRPGPQ